MKKYIFAVIACLIYILLLNVILSAFGTSFKKIGLILKFILLVAPVMGIWKFFTEVKEQIQNITVSSEKEVIIKIKDKYQQLIGYFDTFDLYNKPTVLVDKPDLYKMGWKGDTSIMNIALSEINNILNITCEMDRNYDNLKIRGIDVSKLSSIKTLKTFNYHSSLSQEEIIQQFSVDLENLMES